MLLGTDALTFCKFFTLKWMRRNCPVARWTRLVPNSELTTRTSLGSTLS
jgi:hypothetical protein